MSWNFKALEPFEEGVEESGDDGNYSFGTMTNLCT